MVWCGDAWCGVSIFMHTYVCISLSYLRLLVVHATTLLFVTGHFSVSRSSKPSVPSVRKVTLDHLKKSVPPNKIARVAPERDEVSDRHMH